MKYVNEKKTVNYFIPSLFMFTWEKGKQRYWEKREHVQNYHPDFSFTDFFSSLKASWDSKSLLCPLSAKHYFMVVTLPFLRSHIHSWGQLAGEKTQFLHFIDSINSQIRIIVLKSQGTSSSHQFGSVDYHCKSHPLLFFITFLWLILKLENLSTLEINTWIGRMHLTF